MSGAIGLALSANNTIEFNDVSRANLDSQDSGPINLWAAGPGNLIRNNRVHDTDIPFSFGMGIYLDDDTRQTTVTRNLVHDLQQRPGGGVTYAGILAKSFENRIVNNVVAMNRFSLGAVQLVNTGGQIATRDTELLRNILYRNTTTQVYALTQPWVESLLKRADQNLFFHEGDRYEVAFGTGPSRKETLAEWRSGHGQQHDQNSVVADPRFVDAENRDFRLRPDSPAYLLGFEEIDFASIGLRADFPFADPEEELARVFVSTAASGPSASLRLAVGASAPLQVMAWTRTGYVANLANATVLFSSDTPAVATVDGQGMVTARGPGVATITIDILKGGVRRSTVLYALVAQSS